MRSFHEEKEKINISWKRLDSKWEAPNKNNFYSRQLVPVVQNLEQKDGCISRLFQTFQIVGSVADDDISF